MFGRATIRLGIGPHSSITLTTAYGPKYNLSESECTCTCTKMFVYVIFCNFCEI